ncbi:hypothetical protein AURDEDRAFT_165332 [Auricularia subglabra TFB-10046 SS5]|nr:hypothetical protein AURDEDRAFT_165332 [Auricularia subglabra TFB-10046 SS5]
MPPTAGDEHYRASTLGLALGDTLDELINEDKIPMALAMKILRKFDAAFAKQLPEAEGKVGLKGHIDYYQNSSEVWTFVLDDAQVWLCDRSQAGRPDMKRKEDLRLARLKIIATKANTADDGTGKKRR